MTRFLQRSDAVRRFLETEEEMTVIDVDTQGLGLPADVSKKILEENFLRVAGTAPKSINRAALKDYVEKYRHLIVDQAMLDYILQNV